MFVSFFLVNIVFTLMLLPVYDLSQLRFGFDSTTTENEHVHVFAESRGVVANQMSEAGSSYERRKKN